MAPSAGDSKSNADLSLSNSASFWPLATLAPGATARLIMVSSLTVAPMAGIGTSMMKLDMSFCGLNDAHQRGAVNSELSRCFGVLPAALAYSRTAFQTARQEAINPGIS